MRVHRGLLPLCHPFHPTVPERISYSGRDASHLPIPAPVSRPEPRWQVESSWWMGIASAGSAEPWRRSEGTAAGLMRIVPRRPCVWWGWIGGWREMHPRHEPIVRGACRPRPGGSWSETRKALHRILLQDFHPARRRCSPNVVRVFFARPRHRILSRPKPRIPRHAARAEPERTGRENLTGRLHWTSFRRTSPRSRGSTSFPPFCASSRK